jgi:hypothetical protein
MAQLSDIRSGLAARMNTISGLRARDVIPDNIAPPMAFVNPTQIQYDLDNARGLVQYTFTVSLFASRADSRSAQNTVDEFVSTSGLKSVKAAIEADRTLGGIVDTCRVTNVTNYVVQDANDTEFLAVDFNVEVYGQ